MKRFIVTSQNRISFDNLDNAIDCAKRFAQNNDCSIYVSELVGAVHPGKPRWRPTERKKRAEKPNYDRPMNYKFRILDFGLNGKIPVIKEIRALTGLSLAESKALSEGHGYFILYLNKTEFSIVKASLEASGATIDFEVSKP